MIPRGGARVLVLLMAAVMVAELAIKLHQLRALKRLESFPPRVRSKRAAELALKLYQFHALKRLEPRAPRVVRFKRARGILALLLAGPGGWRYVVALSRFRRALRKGVIP